MKKSIVTVTDHAVLRYLERVEGLDVERVRREIGRRVDRVALAGASAVLIEGHRYVLSPMGSVVTVMSAARPERGRGSG
ncbi:hypothetical protein [Acidimangrovimonas sediminis]|uniref:hypothetical protein n=1 Tax=Acidimangrovimonas sediminis TaxID=2056283 RepID=UPI000C7FC763|nr:hypothetical protein [Acidimangrovimonas sediminis]